MNELDEMWSQMLSQALENAKASGRHDVADYLNLKATNDAVRQTGLKWLFDAVVEAAGDANRRGGSISIETSDVHNFAYRNANIVGSMARLHYGVRCLTVEAGWTRTPTDGFMRGGALAFGRLVHKGMPKANEEIALTLIEQTPVWKVISDEKAAGSFRLDALHRHLEILTDG
jgi:hypothetical protein